MWHVILIIVCLLLGLVAYERYGDYVRDVVFGQQSEYTIYVDRVAFSVSLADTMEERKLGLSGTQSLPQYGGKLFIFDTAAKQGIWMQDMLMPIDILWFSERFELIHIEENVQPDTYPRIFAPTSDARFVLEINAHAVKSLGIGLGNSLVLPAAIIPGDLKNSFQL